MAPTIPALNEYQQPETDVSSGEEAKRSDQPPEAEPHNGRACCDRCGRRIAGIRHKCQDCPDFDYCEWCVVDAALIHPGHTFLSSLPATPQVKETDEPADDDSSGTDKVASLVSSACIGANGCMSCYHTIELLPAIIRECNSPNPSERIQQLMKAPTSEAQASLRWVLRISHLVEAAQRGCTFCCFCLDKFFGPTNMVFMSYEPSKSWYAEPLAHDKERQELVAHCMSTLTRLAQDRFVFSITALCSKTGAKLPDFDRLHIAAENKETSKYQDMDKLGGVFPSAGYIEAEMDIYAAEGNAAARDLSSRPPNPSPGTPKAFEQVKSWVKDCQENHGAACESLLPSYLPSRVVDVSGERLRLYESAKGEEGRYTALSYCWGGPQASSTTSSTLTDRIDGFSEEELPQALRDAVKVTRKLGISYIWVDSLCIIQDDDVDKARQISSMGETFKNAFLTICGARADAADKGFLDSWADPDTGLWPALVRMDYPIPHKDAITIEDALAMPKQEMGAILLMDEPEPVAKSFPQPIERRGWCLQEKLLSRRFLSYGRWATWRCNRATWSDGASHPRGEKIASRERQLVDNLLRLPDGSADLFTTNQLQQNWYKLLNDYSKRELGLAEDRLPAIGGIAAEISRITGAEYAAGLWKNNLLHDLMWYAKTREWLTRPEQWRAPSWSWGSVECPVKYGDITGDATPLARIISCGVTPAPWNNSFGQVVSGRLEVRGRMAEIQREDVVKLLDQQNMAAPPPSSNRVSDWYQQLLEEIADGPKKRVEKEDWEAALPEKVYGLLTFSRDWRQKYEKRTEVVCYFGLLLREVEGGDFERIGAFFNEIDRWVDQQVQPWEERTVVLV